MITIELSELDIHYITVALKDNITKNREIMIDKTEPEDRREIASIHSRHCQEIIDQLSEAKHARNKV